MKNLSKTLLTALSLMAFTYYGYAGCNNEPDNNDGDCTMATGENGNTYFCEDSLNRWYDCVKETGDDDEESSLG